MQLLRLAQVKKRIIKIISRMLCFIVDYMCKTAAVTYKRTKVSYILDKANIDSSVIFICIKGASFLSSCKFKYVKDVMNCLFCSLLKAWMTSCCAPHKRMQGWCEPSRTSSAVETRITSHMTTKLYWRQILNFPLPLVLYDRFYFKFFCWCLVVLHTGASYI